VDKKNNEGTKHFSLAKFIAKDLEKAKPYDHKNNPASIE